jgi:hypothetical protein
MWEYADMSSLDVWYSRLDPTSVRRFVRRSDRSYVDKELKESRHHSNVEAFPRLTQEGEKRDFTFFMPAPTLFFTLYVYALHEVRSVYQYTRT